MMLHRQTLLEQTKKNLYKQLNSLNTDPSDTLEAFAKSAQKAIKRGFGNTAILPPNAPSTVKKKGFNAPLVETGDLRDNLAYKISAKKGIKK